MILLPDPQPDECPRVSYTGTTREKKVRNKEKKKRRQSQFIAGGYRNCGTAESCAAARSPGVLPSIGPESMVRTNAPLQSCIQDYADTYIINFR